MKINLFIALGIMVAIGLLATSCSGSIDRDARQLAFLQKERTRAILKMLEFDDSLQLINCRQNLSMATNNYKSYKKRMEMKYNNKKERASFQEAYQRALE